MCIDPANYSAKNKSTTESPFPISCCEKCCPPPRALLLWARGVGQPREGRGCSWHPTEAPPESCALVLKVVPAKHPMDSNRMKLQKHGNVVAATQQWHRGGGQAWQPAHRQERGSSRSPILARVGKGTGKNQLNGKAGQ